MPRRKQRRVTDKVCVWGRGKPIGGVREDITESWLFKIKPVDRGTNHVRS